MSNATKTPATGTALLEVKDLVVHFPIGKGQFIRPVDRVSFSIGPGEVLSLVGESGSGKSTIGKALVRMIEPADGSILVGGRDVTHIRGREIKEYRKEAQMVFQDPFGSLNPTRSIEQHLAFPVRKYRTNKDVSVSEQIDELLTKVGLTPVAETRRKFPHELSGGQRQRVAIARALAVNPKFIVADEPISMLDVSIRAGVLKLMNDLRNDLNLAFLYITHDLASARYIGNRIMVLYGGKVMETAPSAELIKAPTHPYTRLLLTATPGTRHRGPLPETSNSAPNLLEGRKGCPFANRCPLVSEVCRNEEPPLREMSNGHAVACHHPA
ncbi:peptide/nickel transport system ATP-binding protein [Alicyclobacillus sacchari]|uniref:Peptide/nickel transport system ATP-binding protein n=2 Tax=Alicyclobacillus sacchari TaxID=392010 RepID=A0A4R8LNQ6_9BACL|nr:ABC transporter ATP-binding protein [Alicyclobacillus sacchari]TDY47897.1 peptide/nickel transport system ATP-binding protein [Alicyclobacillus sacchari]